MKNPIRVLVYTFIGLTFFIWLLLDAWLGPAGGPTESQVLAFWGRHATAFAFLMGSLMGHWFFGRKSANYSSWFWPFIGILILTGWDVYFLRTYGYVEPATRWSGLWVLLGIPAGSIFWPQQDSESPVP